MAKSKNTKFSKFITFIIGMIGLVLIIIPSYKLSSQFIDYKKSNDLYEKLDKEYVSDNTNTESSDDIEWYFLADVDLDAVKSINSQTVGWIFFENEEISYPILYSGDNDKYLRTALDGTKATAGSIFVEANNSPDFEDSHTIIYGHNMRNLSMFGKLKFYNRDDTYYDGHEFFQIFYDNKIYRYQIFAYETVLDDSFIYEVPFQADENFENFVNNIVKSSQRKTNVSVSSDDKIVTLSTCSTSGDQYRFVVHGVRTDIYTKEK